jgi:hypothetical protein
MRRRLAVPVPCTTKEANNSLPRTRAFDLLFDLARLLWHSRLYAGRTHEYRVDADMMQDKKQRCTSVKVRIRVA